MSEHFAKPRLYDISPFISEQTPVFPGDQGFKRKVSLSFEQQNTYELSSISTTLHIGAHADAPSHYAPEGQSIDQRPLDLYMGDCQVQEIKKNPFDRILVEDLKPLRAGVRRILFKTCSYPHKKWVDSFNSLSPELVKFLAAKGVRLIGIDTPSVDPADDKRLESHLAIHQMNMGILEGLVLDEVPEGFYTLMALPLKILGGEASPVRAVLYTKMGLFHDHLTVTETQ